jgi:hypothetical protein
VKHCPGFRRATSAACGSSYKSQQGILRASAGSIPRGPWRNKRLFWRQEICPSPGIPRPPNFPLPEFFHSFRRGGEVSILTGEFGNDASDDGLLPQLVFREDLRFDVILLAFGIFPCDLPFAGDRVSGPDRDEFLNIKFTKNLQELKTPPGRRISSR